MKLVVYDTTGGDTRQLRLGFNDNYYWDLGRNDTLGGLEFKVKEGAADTPSTKMFIAHTTGNVGIGTTSPGALLDVQNAGNLIAQFKSTTGTAAAYTQWANTSGMLYIGNESSVGGAIFGGTSAYAAVVGTNGARSLQLATNNTVQMTILSGGNVGIGTTTPASALHVIGDIRATGNVIAGGTMTANVGAGNVSAGTFGTTAGKGNYTFEAAANTNNVLKVDATNERIGIGTASPGAKLDVVGGVNVSGTINQGTSLWSTAGISTLYQSSLYGDSRTRSLYTQSFNNGSNNADVWQMFGGEMDATYTLAAPKFKTWTAYPGFAIGKTDAGLMRFVTYASTGSNWNPVSPTDIMTFNTSGNVGIGTTAPVDKLTIYGGGATGQIRMGYSDASSWAIGRENMTTGDFVFVSGASAEKMRITTAGNVGIGTTAPSDVLHIYKTGIANDYVATSIAEGVNLRISNPGNNWDGVAGLIFENSGGAVGTGYAKIGATIKDTSDSDLFFQISNNAVIAEAMRITSTGNVGIGTTDPLTYKLYVAGGAKFDNPIEVGSPSASNHATTKSYVDSLLTGGSTSGNLATLLVTGTTTLASTGGRVDIGANLPALPSKTNIDGSLQVMGTMSATAFYDYDNTSYYINPNTANIGFKTLGSIQSDGAIDNNYFLGNTLVGTATNPGAYKFAVSGTSYFSNQVTMNANLNLGANNISMTGNIGNVTKLTVATIDPLYEIDGEKYATYASSIAGGVKEEFVGRATLSRTYPVESIKYENKDTKYDIQNTNYSYTIDFTKVERGSDLWVWYQAVDFSKDNVEVMATAYGVPVAIAYEIKEKKIVFITNNLQPTTYNRRGETNDLQPTTNDNGIEFSFRLVGKRHDWKDWSTYIKNQNEKPSFILKSK
jgi:hypothetical protein